MNPKNISTLIIQFPSYLRAYGMRYALNLRLSAFICDQKILRRLFMQEI